MNSENDRLASLKKKQSGETNGFMRFLSPSTG